MTPGIFLSYRRQDSDYAVLLYAWLTARFGSTRVFWDREDIDPGRNFRRVLSEQIRGCRALAALIGPGWSPSEWIQREIGAALRRRILVLPILVGDAASLERDQLPKAVRGLADLQHLEASDLRFRDRLMKELDRVLPESSDGAGPQDVRTHRLANLLRDLSDAMQYRALELLVDGQMDRAQTALDQVFDALMALMELEPGNAELELRLGFLYKDLAQASKEGSSRARRYCENGLQLFENLVKKRLGND